MVLIESNLELSSFKIPNLWILTGDDNCIWSKSTWKKKDWVILNEQNYLLVIDPLALSSNSLNPGGVVSWSALPAGGILRLSLRNFLNVSLFLPLLWISVELPTWSGISRVGKWFINLLFLSYWICSFSRWSLNACWVPKVASLRFPGRLSTDSSCWFWFVMKMCSFRDPRSSFLKPDPPPADPVKKSLYENLGVESNFEMPRSALDFGFWDCWRGCVCFC